MLIDTPIQKYEVDGKEFFVKREDLACLPPGPPFAKVRGLYAKLKFLQTQGVDTVAYMETSISMASWGISYFANVLGMKSVIYYPKYKQGLKHEQKEQLKIAHKFGAKLFPIEPPNMLKINFYTARKHFHKNFEGQMLELGLPFDETISEVVQQVDMLYSECLGGTIVVCAGSGTMAAGILRGLGLRSDIKYQRVTATLIAKKKTDVMYNNIFNKSHLTAFDLARINLKVEESDYDYSDAEFCECPFPCSPYYDRKTYKWMLDNYDKLEKPILFWNIGSSFYEDAGRAHETT
jgi:1-aminocyclopropane-1-carboxylate deaminase/D-cysteine desulfhydrase-like pyridoxal-dependent ACC family enzyme